MARRQVWGSSRGRLRCLTGFGLISRASLSVTAPLKFDVVDAAPKYARGVMLNGGGSHAVRDPAGRLVVAYALPTQ